SISASTWPCSTRSFSSTKKRTRCPDTDCGAILTMCASIKASSVTEWVRRLDHQENNKYPSTTNPNPKTTQRTPTKGFLPGAAGGATEAGATGVGGAGAALGGVTGGEIEGVVLTRAPGTRLHCQGILPGLRSPDRTSLMGTF